MDVVDEDTSIFEAAAAAGHVGKREWLMQPGEILRDMAYHFADSPCCQHHCCYRYSVDTIAHHRASMPNGEHARLNAAIQIIESMRDLQHYSEPSKPETRICRSWLQFLLGISSSKMTHAMDSCRNDEDWIWDDADDDNERYAPDTRVQSAASCSYSYQYQCVPMCNVCVCVFGVNVQPSSACTGAGA